MSQHMMYLMPARHWLHTPSLMAAYPVDLQLGAAVQRLSIPTTSRREKIHCYLHNIHDSLPHNS